LCAKAPERRSDMRALMPLVLLACSAAAGCQYDPFAHTYAEKKPKAADLIGTWAIDPEATTYRPARSHAGTSFLHLNADGTFIWSNVPAMYDLDELRAGGSGRWSIEPRQSWWAVQLSWQTTGRQRLTEELMVRSDTGPHMLNKIIGDPDEGEAIVLSRRP
jgi:hypothetical protein